MPSCAVQTHIISTSCVNSCCCICLGFGTPSMVYISIIGSDTSHLEGYVSAVSLCVLFWKKLLHLYLNQVVVLVLRVMIDFKQSHQQWITSCKWCSFSNRFLKVGWLSPRVNAYVVWLDICPPFSIGNGPSCTPTSIWDVSVSSQLCSRGHCKLLKFEGSLLKILFSLPFSLPDWEYPGYITTGGPFGWKSWF